MNPAKDASPAMSKATGLLLVMVISSVGVSVVAWNALDASKLTVGYLSSDASRLPLAHAMYHGWYRNAGLSFKTVEYASEADLLDAMMAGRVDVGYVGLPAVIARETTHGAGLRVLSGSSYNGSSLVVRNGSGITMPGDLANKTVAVQAGSITDMLLARALFNGTAAAGNVNVTALDPRFMPSSLNESTIDGFVARDVYPSVTTRKPVYGDKGFNGVRLNASGDAWGNRTTVVIVARGEIAASQAWAPFLARFLQGHQDAVEYLATPAGREAAVETLKIVYFMNRVDAETVLATIRFTTDVTTTHVVAFIEDMMAFSMVNTTDPATLASTLLA